MKEDAAVLEPNVRNVNRWFVVTWLRWHVKFRCGRKWKTEIYRNTENIIYNHLKQSTDLHSRPLGGSDAPLKARRRIWNASTSPDQKDLNVIYWPFVCGWILTLLLHELDLLSIFNNLHCSVNWRKEHFELNQSGKLHICRLCKCLPLRVV